MKNTPSPCVRNCCLDERDICLGCFRTIEEILRWRDLDEEGKRAVLELTKARKIDRDGLDGQRQ